MKSYNCKACGAEIRVSDNSNFTKCLYCGNNIAFIDSDLDSLNIKKIILFTLDKEQVIKKFKKIIKKEIESLNKIYVPVKYCNYDFDYFIKYISISESDDNSVSYYDSNCFIDGTVKNYLLFGYGKANSVHFPSEISSQKRIDFDPVLLDDVSIEKDTFEKDKIQLEKRLEKLSKNFGYQKGTPGIYMKKSERCFVSNINIEGFTTLIPIYLIKTKDNKIYHFPGVKKKFSIENKSVFKLIVCILTVVLSLIIFFLVKNKLSSFENYFVVIFFLSIISIFVIVYSLETIRKDAEEGSQYDNFKIKYRKIKKYTISKDKVKSNS